jgi:hypothetical protein
MLDACYEAGIQLIVNDSRGNLSTYQRDPAGYAAVFTEAVKDFGSHPAVVGFFIGDEPSGDGIEPCKEICRIQLEVAPHLMPYLNFLPYEYLKNCDERTQGKPFDRWMADFVEASDCPALSFDCYYQMRPEAEYIENFFQNLYHYSRAAKASDRFLFSIVLGTGHFRYRVPNEDELRWQFNASIACGVGGVLWFTFYTPEGNNNYRGSAIDEFGEETETYRAMAHVHKSFLRDYATRLNRSKHLKTTCIGRTYANYSRFHAGHPEAMEQGILAVQSEHGVPGLMSFFEDSDGSKYVMLFNNSYKDSDLFTMTLRPNVKKVTRLYDGGNVDFEKFHWDARFHRYESAVEAGVWLAPGQFNLFQLEY